MKKSWIVIDPALHARVIRRALTGKEYTRGECDAGIRYCEQALRLGNRTHGFLKLWHLNHVLGSDVGLWRPGAEVFVDRNRFKAVVSVDCNGKFGPAVLEWAVKKIGPLARRYGTALVVGRNFSHFLAGKVWMHALAEQGLLASMGGTASLAEVVPPGGRDPVLGTNPLSWAFPTKAALGFNINIDFATSSMSMGGGAGRPPGAGSASERTEGRSPAASVLRHRHER